MSEYETKSEARAKKYSHLRANVGLRRAGYAWFIVSAIVIFLYSAVDIIFISSKSKWFVLGALVILIIWAIILFFSRRIRDDDDWEFDNVEFEEKHYHENGDYLRCKTCLHVFRFDMGHVEDDHREHVAFNCPECGTEGRLPRLDAEKVPAPVPGGQVYTDDFSCGSCEATWSVGALGHKGKAQVAFEGCPHCGVKDQVYSA